MANKVKIIIFLTAVVWLALTPIPADAATTCPAGIKIIPDECLNPKQGNECNPDSFVQLFINLSCVAYKVLPSLAILMIILGGFRLITSAGRAEQIQHGKNVITAVFIGMIIVIGGAWLISFFVITALTGENLESATGKIFPWQQDWWAPQGGGTITPLGGCCVVDGYGCFHAISEQECADKAKLCAANNFTYTPGSLCDRDFNAVCTAYTTGCCLHKTEDLCVDAEEDGCLSSCPGYEWADNTTCLTREKCYEIRLISDN